MRLFSVFCFKNILIDEYYIYICIKQKKQIVQFLSYEKENTTY